MVSDCFEAIANIQLQQSRFEPCRNVLVAVPPQPQCEICVIVPVRDEAESLHSTLTALLHQVNLQGQPFDRTAYEVIVLANNCSDDSAVVARQFASQHPSLALHVVERTLAAADAYIGRVRQILMDEAYRRLISIGQRRGVIASTDGDTQVSATWLAAIQHEIRLGADGVSGRIMTEPTDRAQLDPYTRACYLRAVGYGYLCVELEAYIDPDPFDCLPRHHQHCGASLAVTAEMYAKAGGMPPVRTPEDIAFYRSLVRTGARFRHSPLVRVKTSARQQGRTSNGMANQLSEWSAMGKQDQTYFVDSATAIETRLRARKQLRELWQRYRQEPRTVAEVYAIAKKLCIDTERLYDELNQCHSFGMLYDHVETLQNEAGLWHQRWLKIPIEQAVAELRSRISNLRGCASTALSTRSF